MIKVHCDMCGYPTVVNGATPEMYVGAVMQGAQTLDKLQQVAFLLGVGMGHDAQDTFQGALVAIEKLFGSMQYIADHTGDLSTQQELLEAIARYERRKAQLVEVQEKANER